MRKIESGTCFIPSLKGKRRWAKMIPHTPRLTWYLVTRDSLTLEKRDWLL